MNSYSGKVLVGNWFEEQLDITTKLDRYMLMRELKCLQLQKFKRFVGTVLRPVDVAPKTSIKFGENVQLKARRPGSTATPEGVVLSALLCGRDMETDSAFMEGTLITCSKEHTPMIRNVFEICPVEEEDQIGDELTYGKEFALRFLGTSVEDPMYVGVEIPIYHTPAGNKTRHPALHLDSRKCRSSTWKALYIHKDDQKDKMGSLVPSEKDIIIVNGATNLYLCCESRYWFPTIFGMECEATTFIYRDHFKRELGMNLWSIY